MLILTTNRILVELTPVNQPPIVIDAPSQRVTTAVLEVNRGIPGPPGPTFVFETVDLGTFN